MRRALVAAVATIALLFSAGVVAAAPASADVNCPDYAFIGARGSGQPSENYQGPTLGMGAAVFDVYQKIRATVVANGKTIYPEPVQYDAVAVAGLNTIFGLLAFIHVHGPYDASVQGGINNATEQALNIARPCPSTKLIFAGYSQGAEVVGRTVATLPDNERQNTVATILFGDPYFNQSDVNADRSSFTIPYNGSLGTRNSWDGIIDSPVLSYCHNGDPICGAKRHATLGGLETDAVDMAHIVDIASDNGGQLMAQHENYVTDGSTRKASRRVAAILGLTPAPSTGDPVDVAYVIDSTDQMGFRLGEVQADADQLVSSVTGRAADARIAVVDFKGASDAYSARVDVPFTSDGQSVIDGVRAIEPGGGNSAPSGYSMTASGFSGVMAAVNLPWRDNARKIIVLISSTKIHNGPSNSVEFCADDCGPELGSGLYLGAVTQAVQAKGIRVASLTATDRGDVESWQDAVTAAGNGLPVRSNYATGTDFAAVAQGALDAPTAALSVPKTIVTAGLPIDFNAAQTEPGDPSTTIDHYTWSFENGTGDGGGGVSLASRAPSGAKAAQVDTSTDPLPVGIKTTTIPRATTTFQSNGTFNVDLETTASSGQRDRLTTQVTVLPGLVVPSAPPSFTLTPGDGMATLKFTPSSDDPRNVYVVRNSNGDVLDAFVPYVGQNAGAFAARAAATTPLPEVTWPIFNLPNGVAANITLSVGNSAGESPQSPPVQVTPAVPTSSKALYSGGPLNLTNQFNLTDAGSDVYADGDFTCDASAHVNGNVIATGGAHLTSNCHIDGDVFAAGNVTVDGTPVLGGSLTSGGWVKFQSTARVGGSIAAAGTFTSLDGKSTDQLKLLGSVAGSITASAIITSPPKVALHTLAGDVSAWTGFTAKSWRTWMNDTAAANNAPSWSKGRTANPGCTMSTASDSVGGTNTTISGDTILDLRKTSSGCSTVTLQGMTVHLNGSLAILADNFQALQGLTIVGDGAAHNLQILVPGTQKDCTSGKGIALPPSTSIDPTITTKLFSVGKLVIAGPATFSGQIEGGCVTLSGQITVSNKQLDTPGMN